MKPYRWLFSIMTIFFGFGALAQTELDASRQQLIVQGLASVPAEWQAPVGAEDVHIKNGAGRVDVNKTAKFSYYIYTENPSDPASTVTLIPMATSRYTPTYYQTDEWWDANKTALEQAKAKGLPMPRQDMNEVQAWLKQMKLSTNPVVLVMKPGAAPRSLRLQDYLLDYYIRNYAKNGMITLYRGGEKPTETGDWLAGRRPRGARYWTPTATYAWRYARKNAGFIDDLVSGRPPLYVFEIPVDQFTAMVKARNQQLILGTELTKRAHDSFDRGGSFIDHLLGQSDYMGIGDIGLEFEIRANSEGSNQMLKYFKRPIGIQELAQDRLVLLDKTLSRLLKTKPAESDRLKSLYATRKAQTLLEGKILLALQLQLSSQTVTSLLNSLGRPSYYELANVDGTDFLRFVQAKMAALPSRPEATAEELQSLERKFGPGPMACEKAL